MTVDEAARLLRVSKSTLYGHVSRGKYRDAVKRGRPLVFYRDRLVRDYFRNR
ncbi:MAG: helix-turn-helix domain-containing protein [Phycisphaerales bacterium]